MTRGYDSNPKRWSFALGGMAFFVLVVAVVWFTSLQAKKWATENYVEEWRALSDQDGRLILILLGVILVCGFAAAFFSWMRSVCLAAPLVFGLVMNVTTFSRLDGIQYAPLTRNAETSWRNMIQKNSGESWIQLRWTMYEFIRATFGGATFVQFSKEQLVPWQAYAVGGLRDLEIKSYPHRLSDAAVAELERRYTSKHLEDYRNVPYIYLYDSTAPVAGQRFYFVVNGKTNVLIPERELSLATE